LLDSFSCLQCKTDSEKGLQYKDECVSFCPFSFFSIPGNSSCKQCSTTSCNAEISRTPFTITSQSPTKYVGKIDKKIFFKSFSSVSRRLQAGDIDYCLTNIKGLELNKDYKVNTTSKFTFNILECTSELEFFRSFRDKDLEMNLNPSLYSGNNVIIDDQNNPVYAKTGIFKITEYQRFFFQFF
jgi:hypothetical protein